MNENEEDSYEPRGQGRMLNANNKKEIKWQGSLVEQWVGAGAR